MMNGIYTFSQNGRVIGRSTNILTDEGRRHIMRYLANEVPTIGSSIAVGVGNRAPASSDSRLTYEFDRGTIYLISPDYINRNIIFKTTLDVLTVGKIQEVGLYSTDFHAPGSRNLLLMERDVENWSTPSFTSNNNRLGLEALRMGASGNSSSSNILPNVGLDLSEYSNTDIFSLAFFTSNNTGQAITVRFRGQNPANFFETTVTNPAQGYQVASFTKGSMRKQGDMSFNAIDSIEIIVSANTTTAVTIDIDGLRIDSANPDTDNILISRSVLPSVIDKTNSSPLEIEYALQVGL